MLAVSSLAASRSAWPSSVTVLSVMPTVSVSSPTRTIAIELFFVSGLAFDDLEMVGAQPLHPTVATAHHLGRDPHQAEHEGERERQPHEQQEGGTAHVATPLPTSSVMRTA